MLALSPYDFWRTEYPDGVDYADVVRPFLQEHETAIDELLDFCAGLDRQGDAVGIADFRDAADRVVDLIGVVYVGFKRTDRLRAIKK